MRIYRESSHYRTTGYANFGHDPLSKKPHGDGKSSSLRDVGRTTQFLPRKSRPDLRDPCLRTMAFYPLIHSTVLNRGCAWRSQPNLRLSRTIRGRTSLLVSIWGSVIDFSASDVSWIDGMNSPNIKGDKERMELIVGRLGLPAPLLRPLALSRPPDPIIGGRVMAILKEEERTHYAVKDYWGEYALYSG